MKIIDKITPSIYPNPAMLVSAKHEDKESIITISWAGTCASDPPTVHISVRPDRYSHSLIEKSQEFVINIPTVDLLKDVKLCGSKSGQDIDKWKMCNFTKGESREVKVPRIEECPVNIECKVKQVIKLGSHDMFIAKVVALHIDEEWKNKGYQDMITYTRGTYKICNAVPEE